MDVRTSYTPDYTIEIASGAILVCIDYNRSNHLSYIQYRDEHNDIMVFTDSQGVKPLVFSSSCDMLIEWRQRHRSYKCEQKIFNKSFTCKLNYASNDVDTVVDKIFTKLNDNCPNLVDRIRALDDNAAIDDMCRRLYGIHKVLELKFAD